MLSQQDHRSFLHTDRDHTSTGNPDRTLPDRERTYAHADQQDLQNNQNSQILRSIKKQERKNLILSEKNKILSFTMDEFEMK